MFSIIIIKCKYEQLRINKNTHTIQKYHMGMIILTNFDNLLLANVTHNTLSRAIILRVIDIGWKEQQGNILILAYFNSILIITSQCNTQYPIIYGFLVWNWILFVNSQYHSFTRIMIFLQHIGCYLLRLLQEHHRI